MNVDFNSVVFFIQQRWVGFNLQFGHTNVGLCFKFTPNYFVFLQESPQLCVTKQYDMNVIKATFLVALMDSVSFYMCLSGCSGTTRRHGC